MVTDNTGQHSYLSLQTKYLTILPQNAGKHVYKALKGQFINHNILTLLMNMLLLNWLFQIHCTSKSIHCQLLKFKVINWSWISKMVNKLLGLVSSVTALTGNGACFRIFVNENDQCLLTILKARKHFLDTKWRYFIPQ